MTIIEQSILPKRTLAKLEDAVVITDHFVAVIDGSTSKSSLPALPNGKTGGQMAAEIVSSVIRTMPAETDIHGFVERANAAFRAQYISILGTQLSLSESALMARLQAHPEDRWTCSIVLYSRHENSLWMIGDCQAMVRTFSAGNAAPEEAIFTNEKPQEAMLADMRSRIVKQMLERGETTIESLREHDSARDQIISAMVREMTNQNVTYSVLDGFPVVWEKVRVLPVLGTEIVLASDGYPRLFGTLEETEKYLRKVLTEDPLMVRLHPATKAWMKGTDSFDDRTYVRIKLLLA